MTALFSKKFCSDWQNIDKIRQQLTTYLQCLGFGQGLKPFGKGAPPKGWPSDLDWLERPKKILWYQEMQHRDQIDLRVGVFDTLSDSIQCLNFAKKWFIQYMIQYRFTQDSIQNIIQFKKILLIQFKDNSIQ